MMMFNMVSKFFDFVLSPFAEMSPYAGLSLISVVTGVVMVFLYSWTTDQKKLKEIRDKIKIHFLEVRLFKEDMAEMFTIQREIIKENLNYLRYTFKSAVVLILPILFIVIDLNARYSFYPIRPGDSFVVAAVAQDQNSLARIELILPQGLSMDVSSMRIPEEKRVSWQIHAGSSGIYNLIFHQGEKQYMHNAVISSRIQRIYPDMKTEKEWISRLTSNAGLLPSDSPIQMIHIEYPKQESFLGLQPGWLYFFFLISMIAGLAVKKMMNLA